MARDGQIRLPDGPAPTTYTVPNAAEIVPKAINATFDGTGASGSFAPTVEYVSDGGVVVARVPCQTTVAAGGSAEVTFAPFLRGGGAAGSTATWAGLYIDTSASPTVAEPYPTLEYQVPPFNNLAAVCFFRTNAPGVWSLFTTDRVHGDVSLVMDGGGAAWTFYAESGVRVNPSDGTGWSTLDLMTVYEGVEVFMEWTGPDDSVDPDNATERNTAPQEVRAVWDRPTQAISSVWFTRSSMWTYDDATLHTPWTLTMDFVNGRTTNPALAILEAYLHVFAVPAMSGFQTTELPIVP